VSLTAPPSMVLTGHPVVEFQPAVDLATGRLLGFEALARWDHPTRGHIPPEILIPWAESSDDILALNAWVIEQACLSASSWASGLQLAVNCSIVQLHQRQASKAVANALELSGLNPDRLTVEITERAAADHDATADLRDLAALGVHLAVDDVGTSWSTLQPLRRLSVEIVKIDKAFVGGLEPREGMNRAIVEAIVHVSHSLNMSTVAEGVESAEQAAILRQFGADAAQGYYYCPPLPVEKACEIASMEPRPILPSAALVSVARPRTLEQVAPSSATGHYGSSDSKLIPPGVIEVPSAPPPASSKSVPVVPPEGGEAASNGKTPSRPARATKTSRTSSRAAPVPASQHEPHDDRADGRVASRTDATEATATRPSASRRSRSARKSG